MALIFKDNFYELSSMRTEGQKTLYARVNLNSRHPVFSGHFPGQPVVPGVILIQMVAELISIWVDHEVEIKEIKTVKYLAMVDPVTHQHIEIKIDKTAEHLDSIHINAAVFAGEQVFMKCKGLFRKA